MKPGCMLDLLLEWSSTLSLLQMFLRLFPSFCKTEFEKGKIESKEPNLAFSPRVVTGNSKGSGNVVLKVVKCKDERNSSIFLLVFLTAILFLQHRS